MAAWRFVRHGESGGGEEGVFVDVDLGALEWPGWMMHLDARESASRRMGVEAVAFGGPMFERAEGGVKHFADGAVAAAEMCVAPTSDAVEAKSIGVARELDAGEMVGEVEEGATGENGGRGVGVEAEEPDAGFAVGDDVGADVDLGKRREAGECREAARCNARHAERNESEPGFAFVAVEREPGGKGPFEDARVDSAMDEGEIEPAHVHGPRARRERPRAMRCLLEERVHRASGGRDGGTIILRSSTRGGGRE